MISTLDVLSHGRSYFGIGAAWYEHETVSLGMPFPSTSERFERLEDILRLAKHMWSGETSGFSGQHVQVPAPINNPQPLSRPHPPIIIGGMGPRKTLRLVAQYGDACNFFGRSEDDLLRERLAVLAQHCDDVGREYDEIEKTVLLTADFEDGTTRSTIDRGLELMALGFEHFIFNIKGNYTPAAIERFSEEIIPALKS
jgi:alkanesulfonate monooxygenase SsuD/methylene tetrahydromethanopterin reductase-like flavin-dependent oxidoreductase (luciferase family)